MLIIIWISIILLFQFNWDFIYSAIIHVSDVSDDPREFSRAEYSADHSDETSFDETSGICALCSSGWYV
jgi:hypothetical protein